MSYGGRDGIVIPEETARAEAVPDDLDAGTRGPYRFPDPRRRRWASWIYMAVAALLAALAFSEPGLWITALLLAAIAAYQWWASWPLALDQAGALQTAAARVPFGVGHASVAVTFSGIRSRPRWQVIVYSSESPPKHRALVEIDGVTGESSEDVYLEVLEPPQA
ncbi:MAG: hypothetical protein OXI56_07195 [bacterium]|nr:hypothetical protein [bacterium]MDE0601565.1 hypothetical protein [bacterium]